MPWGSMGDIWAEFGLDYTKFQQGVQQVTQELVKLDGKYREAAARMEQTVNASLEQLGASIYAASAKQQLLGDSFDANAARARALEQALDQLLMAGVSPTNERVQELAQELQGVRGRMEEAAQAAQQMNAQFVSAGERIKATAQEMSQLGSQMSIGLSLPLTALTGFAAKAAADFESAMAKVWTITDQSKAQMESLAAQIEQMSTSIPQSAQQLAAGLYDAMGSGITDVAEAMQVLEVAAKAGQAGATSTAVAMDALTSAINAYGMEASQAGELADVMFRAMDRGKLTFEEIAGNLGQVISTAAVAGVQFEEVAAAFATLTKGGVGASEAATAVNQAILTIIQPSEQAAAYAKSLGIEFSAAALASKGLSGVMEDVYQATGGNIEAMTSLFDNVRALKGALGLTRNEMADYNSDLAAMSTASGAAERAFEKQMQTSAAQAQLFKNEIANLGRAFGSELLPMLNDAMERVKPLIQAFTDLPEGAQRAAVVFATVTAAIGPLMAAVGGLINILSGPAGWVVAITAVGSAIYGLVSSARDLEGQIDRQISSAREAINEAMSQANAYERQVSALDGLIAEYEELEGKPDKSQEEHERLRQVIDEIVRLAPTAVTGFDDMGKALIGNAEAAKRYREQLWSLRNDQLQLAAMRVKYELPRLQEQLSAYGPEFEKVSKELLGIQDRYFKMRETISKMDLAKTDAERDKILDAAYKTGVFAAGGAPPATQYASMEKQYSTLYERYTTLAAIVEKATAAVIDLRKAEEELSAHQALKPGETVASKVAAASATPSKGGGPLPDKDDAESLPAEWEAWTSEVEKLSKDSYGKLKQAWKEITEQLSSDSIAVATYAEMKAGALLDAISKALKASDGNVTAAVDAASLEVKSGFASLKEKLKAETETDFAAYGRKIAQMPREVFGGLIDEWAKIGEEMKSQDPAVAFYAQKRSQALVSALTKSLTDGKGDWDAAVKAAQAEYEGGYESLVKKQQESATKAQTEFAEIGKRIAEADRGVYGALMDEWASITKDLESKDPFIAIWAQERAQTLLSAIREGLLKSNNDADIALKAALAELESNYKSILERFKDPAKAGTSKAVSEFAAFGEEVAKQSRETYGLVMDEWAKLTEALSGEDDGSLTRVWAEARANLLLSILRDAVVQGVGSLEERVTAGMDAAMQEVEGGYKSLQRSLQSGFSDAMGEFQHKVVMGDLVGADAQIAELERIRDAYATTTDEIWRIDEQIHQLREAQRSQAVRGAYEQFQMDVKLYGLSAQEQAEYLQRLLDDAALNADERKELAGELALVQKQAAEDAADYSRRVNDDWNKYYLDSGMKTRAQLLEEEEAAAYVRLAEALRTGKDVEAAEVALAQAQLALRQQDRKDAEERHQFLVGMGALTLEAQLEQVQAWLAMETESSDKWRELKLEEKSLLTRLRTEMFEEFRAAQDYSQPLSEIFRGQADWLRENVLLAKGLALSSDERLKTESQVYDLMLKSFGAAKKEQQWTPGQEKANLAAYLGPYAANADLRTAYKQLELDTEARAAEEEAKIRDKAFADALAAAQNELAITEKNAEKEKAVFNRVMDEKLSAGNRTDAAIAAINQRNAEYDFRIQQEAAKRAEADADRRVALAIREADAKLDAQVWGITEYRAELGRLLRDEVNMSSAAAEKIEDKRRELWTKEQKEARKATEAGWQSEIDAEVAKWDERLKLEKNGSEAQAAIAREATKALQAELDKRMEAENITEGQKAKLQKAIGDFDFQAKDKDAAAKREAWDQEVSDHIDAIRRQVETEKNLGHAEAAKDLRDYLDGRLAAKNITYSKERELEKLALDYEAKARAQAQKDNEDLWDRDVASAIDRSRKVIDIAKTEAKANGASAEQAYRDEAVNLQKILDERLKSGSITLSAAEKLNQEIAKLNHEAGLAALEASNSASDQAVAAKLREVDAKLSLDKNYAVAILDLQEYLNDETVKLTALGRERLNAAVGKYETDAKLQAQKDSESRWKFEIDARVSAAQQSAKLAKEQEKSYADALEHEADELKKFLDGRKTAGIVTLKQEEDLLKEITSMRQDAEIERVRESKSSADRALGDKMAAVKEQLKLDHDYEKARAELAAYAEKHGAEVSKGAASTLRSYLESLDTDATLQHRKNLEEMVKEQIKSIELRMAAEGFGYARAGEMLQEWLKDNKEALAEWTGANAIAIDKTAEWKAKADADARKADEQRWKFEIDAEVSAARNAAKMDRERGQSYAEALEQQASDLATYLDGRRRAETITAAQEMELLRQINEMKLEAELERLKESNDLSDRAAAAEIERVNKQLKRDGDYAKAKADITKYQLEHEAELTQKSKDALTSRLGDLDDEQTLAHRNALEKQVKDEIEAIEKRISRQGLSYTEATQLLQDWLEENKEALAEWAGAAGIAFEQILDWTEKADEAGRKSAAGWADTMAGIDKKIRTSYDDRIAAIYDAAAALAGKTTNMGEINRIYQAADLDAAAVYAEKARDEITLIRILYAQSALEQVRELTKLLETYVDLGAAGMQAAADIKKAMDSLNLSIEDATALLQLQVDAWQADPLTVSLDALKAQKTEYAGIVSDTALIDKWFAQEAAKATEAAIKQRIGSAERMSAHEVDAAEDALAAIRVIVMEYVGAESDAMAAVLAASVQLALRRVQIEEEAGETRSALAMDQAEEMARLRGDEDEQLLISLEKRIQAMREAGWGEVEITQWVVASNAKARRDAERAEFEALKRMGLVSITEEADQALAAARETQASFQKRTQGAVAYYDLLATLVREADESELESLQDTLAAQSEVWAGLGDGAQLYLAAVNAAIGQADEKMVQAQKDAAEKAARDASDAALKARRDQDQNVRDQIREIEQKAYLEEWAYDRIADAIQGVLDAETMTARLRSDLAYKVEANRKKALDKASADEKKAAEEAARAAEKAAQAAEKAATEEAKAQDEKVRGLVQTAKREAELNDWTYSQVADAIQEVLDAETMSAQLQADLEHQVALNRKQDADKAVADAEKQAKAAEKAAEGEITAQDAWVKARQQAVQRAAALDDWSHQQMADALQEILDKEEMSAELRIALEHETAMAVKRAAADKAKAEEDSWALQQRLGLVTTQQLIQREAELAEAAQQNANARASAIGKMYEAVMGLANDAKLDELKGIRETMDALRAKWAAMGEGWELYALAAEMALKQIDELIGDRERSWGKALADSILNNLGALGDVIVSFQRNAATYDKPAQAFLMTLAELVMKSRQFAALVDALNPLIEELIDMFGQLIAPLVPMVEIVVRILTPVIRAVAAVFAWVADVIVGIYNAVAKAINFFLGWLGVKIPLIEKSWRQDHGIDGEGSGSAGTQISEITGPSRDILVELLRPLRVLDSLPVYAASMEQAIYSMREAFIAYAGGQAAASGAAAAVVNNYYSINTIQIYSSGEEDFDQLMQSLGRRADLALLGSGA